MTIVDSDQMAIRAGYPEYLARCLSDRDGLGLLSNDPTHQGPTTRIPPAITAHKEIALWRPWLSQFEHGEQEFVHWTFWPATVFFKEAGYALVERFAHDARLQEILSQSSLWATEEVLFPTLTKLLGFRVERNPCSDHCVKYRARYTQQEVDAAVRDVTAYFIHPVKRVYADPIRARIRQSHALNPEVPAKVASEHPPHHPEQLWPMLRVMRGIEGWLEDEEAELLAIVARSVLAEPVERQRSFVEVGSYCGKATYVLAQIAKASTRDVRIHAIDTFDGVLGARGQSLHRVQPSLEKFKRTLVRTGIESLVDTIVARAPELQWTGSVDLLLIDGLHDYASITQDFGAFAAHLAASAIVAFHDFADYFPDVARFVSELLDTGKWNNWAHSGTLRVLTRKQGE